MGCGRHSRFDSVWQNDMQTRRIVGQSIRRNPDPATTIGRDGAVPVEDTSDTSPFADLIQRARDAIASGSQEDQVILITSGPGYRRKPADHSTLCSAQLMCSAGAL